MLLLRPKLIQWHDTALCRHISLCGIKLKLSDTSPLCELVLRDIQELSFSLRSITAEWLLPLWFCECSKIIWKLTSSGMQWDNLDTPCIQLLVKVISRSYSSTGWAGVLLTGEKAGVRRAEYSMDVVCAAGGWRGYAENGDCSCGGGPSPLLPPHSPSCPAVATATRLR